MFIMLLFGVFVFSWKSVPHYVAILLSALCLKMENAFMVVSVSAIHDIQYTQVLVAYAGIGRLSRTNGKGEKMVRGVKYFF